MKVFEACAHSQLESEMIGAEGARGGPGPWAVVGGSCT